MEKLNFWCKIIASVSVISSVFSLILPESRQKKAFNISLSIILIFALIYPFNGNENLTVDFSHGLINKSKDDFRHTVTDYENKALLYAAETETVEYIKNVLSVLEIDCECETVCAMEDELIVIKKVILKGNISEKNYGLVFAEIFEIANAETEVIINGERYERD